MLALTPEKALLNERPLLMDRTTWLCQTAMSQQKDLYRTTPDDFRLQKVANGGDLLRYILSQNLCSGVLSSTDVAKAVAQFSVPLQFLPVSSMPVKGGVLAGEYFLANLSFLAKFSVLWINFRVLDEYWSILVEVFAIS